MRLRHRLEALNRLQKTRMFKIIASAVVLIVATALGTTYSIKRAADKADVVSVNTSEVENIRVEDAKTEEERQFAEEIARERSNAEAASKAINRILRARADSTGVWAGLGIVSAMALGVIWLGLGLTTLGVVVCVGVVAWPLVYFGQRAGSRGVEGAGKFIVGVAALAMSFFVLIELLRVALSGRGATVAIARNVVNEAVRMKISLVFIVLLLLGLAALPGLLDESTPLRYRVQSFLQYGTGGTFWTIAILVLLLSVGSVAFEQRDKIIWQTMTKPVAPWRYIFGKWLGVTGVAAVMLGVSCSGIFLFTEYLREQPAQGERAAYQASKGEIADDRFILETQVLAARASVRPEIPRLTEESLKNEVTKVVQQRMALAAAANTSYEPDGADLAKIVEQIEKERTTQFFTLEGGTRRAMRFTGLGDAKRQGLPITLRYKVSAGSDDPRYTHRVTFLFPNLPPRVQEVPLGQAMSIDVSPVAISSEGVLEMEVANADFYEQTYTEDTMSFPPDGIEVFYPVGSYRANFMRAVVVLWLKLAMLAMVGVSAATFLSFSVASLVSFGVFILAESTSFLTRSLENFEMVDSGGKLNFLNVAVRAVAVPASHIFRTYSGLEPTANLVDGRLIPSWDMLSAVIVLGVFTLVLFGAGVMIFKNRELATYSGQ